jgi:glycosyltransferase involved in cell wall biosynthesis
LIQGGGVVQSRAERKRILVIINEWPVEMMGGSELHMLQVARCWSADHDVDVLLPRTAYVHAQSYLKGQAIVTDSLLEKQTANLLGRLALMSSRVFRILLSPPQKKYDVIVAASHYLTDVVPAVYLLGRNPSSKFIAYHHSGVSAGNWMLAFLRKVNDAISLRLLQRHANLIFAITQPIKDSLILRGIDERRILITDNAASKVECNVDPEAVLFDGCFVGRLEKGKGVFDLVTIWKTVSDEIPTAKLAIIGAGSEKDRLVKVIDEARLNKNIVLCGFVDDKKKFEVMHRSKLFLLPSYVDARPIAIIEAMGCGLPVVAYDLPALRPIWGQDVLYVPQTDTGAFAATVIKLLEDPRLRSELSRRALRRGNTASTWKDIAAYEANAIERA